MLRWRSTVATLATAALALLLAADAVRAHKWGARSPPRRPPPRRHPPIRLPPAIRQPPASPPPQGTPRQPARRRPPPSPPPPSPPSLPPPMRPPPTYEPYTSRDSQYGDDLHVLSLHLDPRVAPPPPIDPPPPPSPPPPPPATPPNLPPPPWTPYPPWAPDPPPSPEWAPPPDSLPAGGGGDGWGGRRRQQEQPGGGGSGGGGGGVVLDAAAVEDDEVRLFFTVSSVMPSPPDDKLPYDMWAKVYRRVDMASNKAAAEAAGFESGDRVWLQGTARTPQSLPSGATAATAAGAATRAAEQPQRHRELRSIHASATATATTTTTGVLASSSSGSGSPGPALSGEPDDEPDCDAISAEEASRLARSWYVGRLSLDPVAVEGVATLTVLLSVCGQAPHLGPQDLTPYWFGDAPEGPSLQQFFETCSHGGYEFSPDRNQVVGPIEVPCAGTPSSGRPYAEGRCTDREVFGWAQAALDVLARDSPDLLLPGPSPQRRVFVLPDLPACRSWASLASVGCGPRSCASFLKMLPDATPASVASSLMHGLGHAFSLAHAGAAGGATASGSSRGGPAADGSCVMGEAAEGAGLVCPNGPNAWKVGWSTLLGSGDDSNITLPRSWPQRFRLPPASAAANSLVAVSLNPTWTADADGVGGFWATYYLSYRTAAEAGGGAGAYDAGLRPDLSGVVYVHRYDGDTTRLGTPHKPLLVGSSASLAPDGATLRLPAEAAAWFRVRLEGAHASGADVTVCTSTGGRIPDSEAASDCQMCFDGVDNDCNGQTDLEDKACRVICFGFPE